jgi:hypothetical protein
MHCIALHGMGICPGAFVVSSSQAETGVRFVQRFTSCPSLHPVLIVAILFSSSVLQYSGYHLSAINKYACCNLQSASDLHALMPRTNGS